MGLFDSNIPKSNVEDFKKNFKYGGKSWSDLDSRGKHDNQISSQKMRASERIEKAKEQGNISGLKRPKMMGRAEYETGGWFDSYQSGLVDSGSDFFGKYSKNKVRQEDLDRENPIFESEITNQRSEHGRGRVGYKKGSWFDKQKSNMKKSYNGRYHENFERYENLSRAKNIRSPEGLQKYTTHRSGNVHFGAQAVGRHAYTQQESSANNLNDGELGKLISDFDNEIERTKPHEVFQKVDRAIEIAEQLEASNIDSANYIQNLEALISVFDLMDSIIQNDVIRLEGVRDGDKRNRGKDTGKQTSTELGAVSGLSARATERGDLIKKRGELQQKLTLKKTFNR
jgi:hypothetical protein